MGSGLRTTALLALALVGFAGPARGQAGEAVEERPLTLEQAVAAAREGSVDLAVAEVERSIAAAEARKASAFLWPRVDLGSGVVRSVDPVFAFGTRLRQARFGQADLALDALNDPDPITDWSATADVAWGALDPARWAGWSAARHRARSAGWGTIRTREATELRARSLYWSAVRAAARLEAAGASEEAARETLELFRARQERGLLTDADRLRAEAELDAARARRVDAARARREARRRLGVLLGWESGVLPVPTDTLTVPAGYAPGEFDPAERADLRSMAAALEAREARVRQATFSFLPAIDAFGQAVSHGADVLESDGSDWTVGLQLRWTAFAGFGRWAERSRVSSAERIARLRYEHAVRQARADIEIADRAVTAAAETVEAALAARRAAVTAADLMRRRFEEGLATASDLLQAEARKAEMRTRAVDALAGYRLAEARARFVRSRTDPEDLP
ncbi:MAG: TolC family protein [Gemmatimonadota bacterium]|nr:TolC family protein [Gemmatimonadota bacterium]